MKSVRIKSPIIRVTESSENIHGWGTRIIITDDQDNVFIQTQYV